MLRASFALLVLVFLGSSRLTLALQSSSYARQASLATTNSDVYKSTSTPLVCVPGTRGPGGTCNCAGAPGYFPDSEPWKDPWCLEGMCYSSIDGDAMCSDVEGGNTTILNDGSRCIGTQRQTECLVNGEQVVLTFSTHKSECMSKQLCYDKMPATLTSNKTWECNCLWGTLPNDPLCKPWHDCMEAKKTELGESLKDILLAVAGRVGCSPKEVLTHMNHFYHDRDASAEDCDWRCKHYEDKGTWCVHSEFSPDNDGTCKLFDCYPQAFEAATAPEAEAAKAVYTKQQGHCRGGPKWLYGMEWDCSPGLKTKDECQAACDANPQCGAFDRTSNGADSLASECCIFMPGNTGNGVANLFCYVKESSLAQIEAAKPRKVTEKQPRSKMSSVTIGREGGLSFLSSDHGTMEPTAGSSASALQTSVLDRVLDAQGTVDVNTVVEFERLKRENADLRSRMQRLGPANPTCVDPVTVDIEAIECECWSDFRRVCEAAAADKKSSCWKNLMCSHNNVCEEWKTHQCSAHERVWNQAAHESLMQQRAGRITSQIDTKIDGTKIVDETLSDKCLDV